jgi:hypothetical protein
MPLRHLETSLHRLYQCRILIHFRDFFQVVFLDAQEAENEFAWPFDTLNHRFIEFITVEFQDDQKADYEFSGPFAYSKHHFD